MRICVFGYKTCPSVHRIMHHATNLRDETGADVLFIDAEKHGISLKVMSERAGCAVEKFPCVLLMTSISNHCHRCRDNLIILIVENHHLV